MNEFRIEITSVSDREQLVAEIWYNDYLIAEINQEKCFLEIELYSYKESLCYSFESFYEALFEAKNKLLNTQSIK